MPTYNASNAECLVFTYKDGLLSAVAHDLKIRVTDFSLNVNEAQDEVSGTFNAGSLRVVNAMSSGAETPGTPGDKDKKTIEDTIVNDVLHSSKHPEIKFENEAHRKVDGGYQVKGNLTLRGVTKSIVVDVREEGDKYVAEAQVHQPDFGIKPYSAMMGTLKIKPDVVVRVSVPRS